MDDNRDISINYSFYAEGRNTRKGEQRAGGGHPKGVPNPAGRCVNIDECQCNGKQLKLF